MKHEFSLIHDYFKPLAKGFGGGLSLADDAALLTCPAGYELVITKDAISAGTHFLGNEPPTLIAKKLLRTNLSDLAAMGATPLIYFVALVLPKDTSEDWIASFAQGLEEDQKLFGLHLAGGDTTATNGIICASLTAIGKIPAGKALKRSGAKAGDIVYVSGTLGDGALGLAQLQRNANANTPLTQRYLLPQPRLLLGEKLQDIATSCLDISDGLVQDLGHICKASGLGATIEAKQIPLSAEAQNLPDALQAALCGGDDYELLFTIPANRSSEVPSISQMLGLPLTAIGTITQGNHVSVVDHQGNVLPLEKPGYQHF